MYYRIRCYVVELDLLSVIALLEDLPASGLKRGQVGTIVELLAPDVYEVEFSDDAGQTYASVAVRREHQIQLRYAPVHQAA